ncbi:MAG: hypothetical protein ACREGF_03810, partial [Candidatus Saccharimonadales bacterium]
MYFIKRLAIILALAAMSSGLLAVTVPAPAYAQVNAKQQACIGLGTAAGESKPTCSGTANGADLSNVVKAIVNLLSIVVGIIAVIMIIVGGIKYAVSGGEA